MPKSPLVSIIIPVFNAEKFLAVCINSALKQTWPNCQLIIVDDHSEDESWQIAESYQRTGVEVVQNLGKGASAARNKGIALAKGDFFQFLDADDLLAPNKIASQMEMLSSSPVGTVASCAWGRFYDNPGDGSFVEERVWRSYPKTWEWLKDSWEGDGMMQTACWLTPRAVIEKAGPWNESISLNDDGEYFCRILLNGKSIAYSSVEGVFYRSSLSGSLSRRDDGVAIESAFRVCELYERHITNSGLAEEFSRALRLNYLNFVYQYYPARKELIQRAWRHCVRLGDGNEPEIGGVNFKKIAKRIGFMNALRLRGLFAQLRHPERSSRG